MESGERSFFVVCSAHCAVCEVYAVYILYVKYVQHVCIRVHGLLSGSCLLVVKIEYEFSAPAAEFVESYYKPLHENPTFPRDEEFTAGGLRCFLSC